VVRFKHNSGGWLEGDKRIGKDVLGAIRYFAGLKKLYKDRFQHVGKTLIGRKT